MDEYNEKCIDYFVIPHLSVGYRCREGYDCFGNGTFKWESYRTSSLDNLLRLFSRTDISALQLTTTNPGMKGGLYVGSVATVVEADRQPAYRRARRLGKKSDAVIQKAAVAERWLLLTLSALRELVSATDVTDDLRSQGMTTLPKPLADRLAGQATLDLAMEASDTGLVGQAHSVEKILHLTVAMAHVSRLISNSRVVGHLSQNRPELLKRLRLIAAASLDRDAGLRSIEHLVYGK